MALEKKDEAAVPSLVGLTPEQFQTLIQTFGMTQASAMREALKSQRKENPNYPAKSVFNPNGIMDSDGKPVENPKPRLKRDTKFLGVWIGRAGQDAELNTPDEVELFNRFKKDVTARDGKWTATIKDKGTSRETLEIDLGSVKTVDDRMGIPPLTFILRELLDGPEAVNPDTMAKRIEELEAKVKRLAGTAA